jgi:hypothetical protein
MADKALIFGESKTGKSTSIEGLDPSTTFIINISDKALPFRGWKKNYTPFNSKDKTGNIISVRKAEHIAKVMDIVDKELPYIITIVVEDFQYMSAFEFMSRIKETGYNKFNDIAANINYIAGLKPQEMRKDLIIFYLNHEEEKSDEKGIVKVKAKTCGQLIDKLITFEGLFTTVLRSNNRKGEKGIEFFFETQSDGMTTAGTPRGMFEEAEIPNNLELVRQAILNYEK